MDDGLGGKRRVVAFGCGNVEPGRATFGLDSSPQDLDVSSGFGGIVIYDGASTLVITDFSKPAIPAGAYLVETGPGSGLQANRKRERAAQLGRVDIELEDAGPGPGQLPGVPDPTTGVTANEEDKIGFSQSLVRASP